ncbi:hypothetical protein DDE83_006224 [Stemphylium lycopersici]|uniref:Uncharacterized protein n=1 Tax=Stemphylium lycopersici TaxID=183478 RepID=A0A364MZL8_STELY|nr:hypothetical protein DDE83_006224 [Stemphylium lycopersici]
MVYITPSTLPPSSSPEFVNTLNRDIPTSALHPDASSLSDKRTQSAALTPPTSPIQTRQPIATFIRPLSPRPLLSSPSTVEMSKRSAESPLSELSLKKQKLVDPTADAEATSAPTEQIQVANVHEASSSVKNDDVEDGANLACNEDKTTTPANKKTGKGAATPQNESKKTKKPPVGDGFVDFQHNITIPASDPFWGVKPVPGDPRPDPHQPSARESNGQTNPPLWEDRGFRFKRGSRYVKYFGPVAPDNVDELKEDLDQEDLLAVKMIDMRPKSKKDPTPKRTPVVYCYGKVPKDWDNMQSIKALNDRRYQAIDRTTMDAPWSRIEREYLASLLRETPDTSIWDLTERHNDRFMGKDYTNETGFGFSSLSTGRTVESVRYEYTTYKPLYDAGRVPDMVRWRGDQSTEGKEIRAAGRAERAFGPPSKALEMAHDAEHGAAEVEDEATPKKLSPKKQRKSNATVDSERDDGLETEPFVGQEKLDEDSEALLELAGAYGSERVSQYSGSGGPSASPGSPRDDFRGDSGKFEEVDDAAAGQISLKESAPQDVPTAGDDKASFVEDTIEEVTPAICEDSQQPSANEPVGLITTVVEQTETVIEHATVTNTVAQTEPQQAAQEVIALAVTTVLAQSGNASTPQERRESVHAARQIEVDEEYGDGEEDEEL